MADTEIPTPTQAAAAGHAKSEAIVQGAVKASSVFPRTSEEPAPAGEYTLLARTWNQLVSAFNEPKRFVKHHRGAIVKLESADADRLLRHGAVKPTNAEQAESAAAQVETPTAKAVAVNDQIGQQPVNDPAQAAT